MKVTVCHLKVTPASASFVTEHRVTFVLDRLRLPHTGMRDVVVVALTAN